MSTLRQAKQALRKQMRSQLAALSPENVTLQSSKVTENLVKHPAFTSARSISVYVSMAHSEVTTEDICRRALEQGKRLYVPRFATAVPNTTTGAAAASVAPSATAAPVGATKFDTDMRMLRVADWSDFEAMVLNRWGIREPADTYNEEQREDALIGATGGNGLDLILAPGVAFDAWGGRLGHGKGYYDRYIASAVAFAERHGAKRPATSACHVFLPVSCEWQRWSFAGC